MKTLESYPSLSYGQSICTSGRIILVDEPLPPDKREQLKNLKTIDNQELILLDDVELAASLENFLATITEKEKNILFVFPGNGSNYPRRLSEIWKKFPGANVNAKRFWKPGAPPFAMAGLIIPETLLLLKFKTIIVVDDVISSGITLSTIYRNNSWRLTEAKWIGATWVCQTPQVRAKSGIKGYERVVASCVVGKPDGKRVPVNSLSTLRADGDMAKNYASRHFADPAAFLTCLRREVMT